MSLFEIKEMRELHVINDQLECGMREEFKNITCPMNSVILEGRVRTQRCDEGLIATS